MVPLSLFLFLLGISVGSFLNVLIDRLPRGEQVFKGRSYCDHCKHKLVGWDLIPIFSWIILRGRCRYCHSPIGGYYPTVELSTGILFVFVAIHLRGVSPPLAGPLHLGGVFSFLILPYHLFLISALIVIFFADLKYQIIPDQIIYPAILISLLYAMRYMPYAIPSAFGAGLFFLAMVIVTRGRGMGGGDVKLAVLMGLVLGFPSIVVALYLAFLTGAFFGVILILTGKKRFGQHIPFGPFLTGATFLSLFWGQNLWQIFQKIVGLP